MDYALGLVRYRPPASEKNPHSEHELDICLELSHEEYRQSSEAIQTLYDFDCQARFLTVVALNYQDYFRALDTRIPAYIQRGDKDPQQSVDMESISLELNRLLINYISSITLYLKRTEIYIQKKYGNESENLRKFNEFRHELYESSFSYRFVYFLRNYAQHAGLPIDHVTLTSTVSPNNSNMITHLLRVRILRDSLLKNYHYETRNENSLKREISKQPSEIDLRPHLVGMMETVHKLNSQFILSELDTLKPSASILNNLLARLPSHEGADPYLFALEVVKDESFLGGGNTVKNWRMIAIPVKAIQYLLAN